jgi:hypothetical protein
MFTLLYLFPVIVQNDSILAFHSHGMQGRSLRNGAITQEITDTSKVYRLLGSERYTGVSRELVSSIS